MKLPPPFRPASVAFAPAFACSTDFDLTSLLVRNIFGDSHGFDDFFGDDVATFFCDVSDVSEVGGFFTVSVAVAAVDDDVVGGVVAVGVVAVVVSEATFLGELSSRMGILDPVKRKKCTIEV